MNLLGGTPRRTASVFRLTDNSATKRSYFGIFFKYCVTNVAYVCIRRIKTHEMKYLLSMDPTVDRQENNLVH